MLGDLLRQLRFPTPLVFLATLGFLPAPILAASGTRITVTAVDEASGLGIARAHVRVENDSESWDGYTDRRGRVTLDNVPPGRYGLEARQPDYAFEAEPLEIRVSDAPVAIRIAGVRTKLPTIATSRTEPSAQLRSNSPEVSIAGTLGQALLDRAGIGGSPMGTLSLNGHAASTTAATIDGAPVFPSGFGISADQLAGDVFSSATLDQGSVAGAPDATLALHTFDPTIDWQGLIAARVASYGATSTTVSERGSAGLLGIAASLARWQAPVAFGGTYRDTSGLLYDHSAADTNAASSVTLRYPFAQSDVVFVDYGTLTTSAPITCPVQLGLLPCGYGPGVSTNSALSYLQLRDEASLPNATLDVHVFHSALADDFEDAGARFFGEPIGSNAQTRTSRNGVLARFGFAYGSGMQANLVYSAASDTSWSRESSATPNLPLPPARDGVESLRADVPFFQTRKTSVAFSLGIDRSGSAERWNEGLSLRYALTPQDALTAFYASGRLSSLQYSASGITPPQALSYDCSSNGALGAGPIAGSESGAPTSQLRVGATHDSAASSLSFGVTRSVDDAPNVEQIVPAADLPSSLIDTSYLSAATLDRTLTCGGHAPVSLTNLYYLVAAPARISVTDSAEISGDVTLGSHLRLSGEYSLTSARAYGGAAFTFRGSTASAGKQLLDLPVAQGSLTMEYSLGASTQLLANWRYVGGNNWFGPRPVSLIALGLLLRTENGLLIATAQNLGNEDAGRGAFAPFPYLTRPAPGRSYGLAYRLILGRNAVNADPFLSQPPLLTAQTVAFVPIAFEPRPAQGWLAPQTASPLCGPEELSLAKILLSAIGSDDETVAQAVERGERLQGLPAISVDGMRISALASPAQYALAIRFDIHAAAFRAFVRCARLHFGSYEVAKGLGLYIPTWQQRVADGSSVIYYAPQAGLYFPPATVDETAAPEEPAVAAAQFPQNLPPDRERIDPRTCPQTYRSSVREALSDIAAYVDAFYARRHASPPPGVSVSAHAGAGGSSLEFRFDDTEFANAFVACTDIPTASAADLRSRHLTAAFYPSINYNPSVGFFRYLPM